MPELFSPLRPFIGSRPCWLDSDIAIPSFDIFPLEKPDWWRVITWASGSIGHRRSSIELHQLQLMILLEDWRVDPELALQHWFKEVPPKGLVPKLRSGEGKQISSASVDDLGL